MPGFNKINRTIAAPTFGFRAWMEIFEMKLYTFQYNPISLICVVKCSQFSSFFIQFNNLLLVFSFDLNELQWSLLFRCIYVLHISQLTVVGVFFLYVSCVCLTQGRAVAAVLLKLNTVGRCEERCCILWKWRLDPVCPTVPAPARIHPPPLDLCSQANTLSPPCQKYGFLTTFTSEIPIFCVVF